MHRQTAGVLASLAALGVALAGPASLAASAPTAAASVSAPTNARPAAGVKGSALEGSTRRAVDTADWATFLYSEAHSSYAAGMDTITTSNASTLTPAWTWIPPKPPTPDLHNGLTSSATVVNGVIYIGANNGSFYALNETTGAVIWSKFVGYVSKTTCGERGFSSTATVTTDPVTHALTVYVNAADGYLYALDAKTGKVDWRALVGIPSTTANNYYAWASPTVANSLVYIGVASFCDVPLVRGGLLALNQSTGARVAAYWNVPAGDVGGTVWSSIAVGAPNNTVYMATGNGPSTDQLLGTSEAVVALNPKTLTLIASWHIRPLEPKGDLDFGASPTLFQAVLRGATKPSLLIGVCNKDGTFYTLRRLAIAKGTAWRANISAKVLAYPNACTSAAAYNGSDLFVASPASLVHGQVYPGSIRELNPSTGAVIWATGLPATVQGSPSLDGAGVLAVPTWDTAPGAANGVYLLSASTGALLTTLSTGGGPDFASAVFAGPYVFVATWSAGLIAYHLP